MITLSIIAASIFMASGQNGKGEQYVHLNPEKKMEVVNSEQSFLLQAARYSQLFPALGITVMRDTSNQKEFEKFKQFLSKKLTEKGIPHKFFVKIIDDKEGAAFAYFIDAYQHGVFSFNEFIALLPEMVRDYRKAHPNAKVDPNNSEISL